MKKTRSPWQTVKQAGKDGAADGKVAAASKLADAYLAAAQLSSEADLVALHGILYLSPSACRELRGLGLPYLKPHTTGALRIYCVCALQDAQLKDDFRKPEFLQRLWSLLKTSVDENRELRCAEGLCSAVTTSSAGDLRSKDLELARNLDRIQAVLQLLNVLYFEHVIAPPAGTSGVEITTRESTILDILKLNPYDEEVQEYATETLAHLARCDVRAKEFFLKQGGEILLRIAAREWPDSEDVKEAVQMACTVLGVDGTKLYEEN